MSTRHCLRGLLRWAGTAGVVAVFVAGGCAGEFSARKAADVDATKETAMTGKVVKTDEEWRASLTPEQYRITRKKGTEPAFCGTFWNHHEEGTYVCVACGAPLFKSEEKFDSGTGWPSYWAPIEGSVRPQVDRSHGMVRTEALCSRCDAHLGHIFEDGPPPTGLRYCINSAALEFEPAAKE